MNRYEPRLVAALSVVLAVAFVLLATPEFRFTGDTEFYVGLARSIARGQGLAGETWRYVQFPPGLPFILAPAAWLFHGSFAAISRWAALLATLVFPLTWLYFHRRNNRFAFALAILTVFTAEFLSLATDNPMSEPVYLVLSLLLFLWADQRAMEAKPSWGATLAGCGLLIAVPAVRSIGMAAIVAALAALAIRSYARKPGERAVAARDFLPPLAGIGFLLAWHLGVQGSGGGYFHDVWMRNPVTPALGHATAAEILMRPWQGIPKLAANAVELLLAGIWIKPSWFTPALLAAAILLIGWWQNLRDPKRFAAIYFPLYLGIVLLWPYDGGARFLIPLLPLTWAYLFDGAQQLLRAVRERKRWPRLGGLIWAVAALALAAAAYVQDSAAFRRQEMAAVLFWVLVSFALTLGWRALGRVAEILNRRTANVLVGIGTTLLACIVLVQATPRIVSRARGTLPMVGPQHSMSEASRWVQGNTATDAPILTTYASRMGFATGRPTVYLPVTLDAERFREIERRERPEYLFIVETDDAYYTPNDVAKFAVLKGLFGTRLRLVYHFDGGSIYAIAAER